MLYHRLAIGGQPESLCGKYFLDVCRQVAGRILLKSGVSGMHQDSPSNSIHISSPGRWRRPAR